MRFYSAILSLFLATSSLSWGRGDIAFVLANGDGKSLVRVVTQDRDCPAVRFDGRRSAMRVRASPGSERGSAFPVLVCEAPVPSGTRSIVAGKIGLHPLDPEAKRIVLMGDTGCRQKGNTFQDCRNHWPFEQISRAAAAFKPDLVIHVGDYLYRETPCPKCSSSVHGYGFDAWNADFFSPAKSLLRAAPWLFVRGNHESCSRAGQGWFRFLDRESLTPSRSCDDPADDQKGDYSTPYSVPVSPDTQLIVFDSSSPDFAHSHYPDEFAMVDRLAKKFPHAFFISHHPLLGFSEWHSRLFPGNSALQSALHETNPAGFFPPEIDATFHGHVHLYEALDFRNDYPATFITGNSGTAMDEALPEKLTADASPYPGAIVRNFFSSRQFGFMTLEKRKGGWLVTERDRFGKPVWFCNLVGNRCANP